MFNRPACDARPNFHALYSFSNKGRCLFPTSMLIIFRGRMEVGFLLGLSCSTYPQLKPVMQEISSFVDLIGTVVRKVSATHLSLAYFPMLWYGASKSCGKYPKEVNGIPKTCSREEHLQKRTYHFFLLLKGRTRPLQSESNCRAFCIRNRNSFQLWHVSLDTREPNRFRNSSQE